MDQVIICGGGPVGLITALGLVRNGIPVTVFEIQDELQDDPRAATTHPASLELLDQLGLEQAVRAAGLVAPVFQFHDRVTGEMVAEFDHAVLEGETKFPYVVQTEQFKISNIVLEQLKQEPQAKILFGHEVIGIQADDDNVTVRTRSNAGEQDHIARYVVASDGARSFVRKSLGIEFEGFTFQEMFMVLTTPFDFEANMGYSYRNYFADPDEWCNCFKVAADGPPGLWRLVFPADPEKPEEELLGEKAVQAKLQKFFPKDGDYELAHRNLYRIHQRVAKTFRQGRVMLAGDASHANNPIGGMGLNGGIQDAMNLVEKLSDVWHGRGDDTLLDLYDIQRRTVATQFVQAQSIQNKKRLETRDHEAREANFRELREMAADPVRAKAFLMQTSMLESMRRANNTFSAGDQ
jgi:3-(3-hydroxy-phenyl)propionate hydroxylase